MLGERWEGVCLVDSSISYKSDESSHCIRGFWLFISITFIEISINFRQRVHT